MPPVFDKSADISIYCFSGTGNTLFVANAMASEIVKNQS